MNVDQVLQLKPVSAEFAAAFVVMRDAFIAAGEDAWQRGASIAHTDPSRYLETLRSWSQGENLPPEWCPADEYLIFAGDVAVGDVSVRHRITTRLKLYGGHIGYSVHPNYRNRGIASWALRAGLTMTAAKGLTEALLTCAHDNEPSIRVIEKAGGKRIVDSLRRRFVISTCFSESSGFDMSGIVVRPVCADDYRTLCTWFADASFVEWWGGKTKPAQEVADKYMGNKPNIRSFIIEHYAVPMGYLQDWRVDDETAGIDIVLLPASQNQGIGTAVLRMHAESLIADGWKNVGIDPLVQNVRAIRSYEKAGFRRTNRGGSWSRLDGIRR